MSHPSKFKKNEKIPVMTEEMLAEFFAQNPGAGTATSSLIEDSPFPAPGFDNTVDEPFVPGSTITAGDLKVPKVGGVTTETEEERQERLEDLKIFFSEMDMRTPSIANRYGGLSSSPNPELSQFREDRGLKFEKGPEFKGNDIELQVDLEKLIENNPVAQVAIKDMMARSGGDLSKILRNLQVGEKDFATSLRGGFTGYTGSNREAVLRNESTYTVFYNEMDVFNKRTNEGKSFVALLENLKVEGLPYPKILEVFKMSSDGSKVFNKEYYDSLSETQKTILQVKAENKENTLTTIVHELMHYGYQTLNDRGYISDAVFKDIERMNTYGFVNTDTKEHVLIDEILTTEGKIPPQTDLQLLAKTDPKELYDFNKRKIARRLASEDLNTNPNIQTSYEDLVEKYLQLPNAEIDKLRLEGVDYFTAQKPSGEERKGFPQKYQGMKTKVNPDYVSMEDENNPNVLEYNRATNEEYLDTYSGGKPIPYQETDAFFSNNRFVMDPTKGPFNQAFRNATYNMQKGRGVFLNERQSLQDKEGNINPTPSSLREGSFQNSGNYGDLNKGLDPLKFATIHGANEWLARNDNPDVKQNFSTQTTKAFERPDNNPRAGYESGQDYLNENKDRPNYLSDGPMEGPNSFQPETYTGPVPELMAEGGFVTGMNWWKDNDLEEMEIEDLTGEEELKFAEGGPVMELDEQTEMAFGNGSARVDPVSGNEVPPGALPEEVRDDIPARLSEGEYVVPADVLQYYGIKFFEDLRGKAKMELSGMEQNGRMGGEPLEEDHVSLEEMPFGAEELQSYEDGQEAPAQGFAEGGPVTEAASMFPTTMIKTYINEAGSKLYIRFVNGIAIPPVPPGYVEEGSTIDPVESVVPTEQEADEDRDTPTGDPVRKTLNEIVKDSMTPGLKPFGTLAVFGDALNKAFPTANTAQIMEYINKNGALPPSGPGIELKDDKGNVVYNAGGTPKFEMHTDGPLINTIKRSSTEDDNIDPTILNTFKTDIYPAFKKNSNADGTFNKKGYAKDLKDVVADDGTVRGKANTEVGEDASNAGDFTGGQTNQGSGPTASGLGGTGKGRSDYNKGGLATRKKKKK